MESCGFVDQLVLAVALPEHCPVGSEIHPTHKTFWVPGRQRIVCLGCGATVQTPGFKRMENLWNPCKVDPTKAGAKQIREAIRQAPSLAAVAGRVTPANRARDKRRGRA